MLKFTKKQNIILILSLLILICGAFIIQKPSIITKLFLIDSRATQQPLSLSVAITGCQEETLIIPASGQVIPTILCNYYHATKITGLTGNIGDTLKVIVYNSSITPSSFTAPSTTQVETVYKYFNITLENPLVGTATILFNLSQSSLGSTDPDDIRMYRYDTSWIELDTIIIDSTADPAEFSSITTSFSPFLIGEKAEDAGLPTVTTPLSGPVSKGGLKLGLEKPVPRPKPVILIPGKVKRIIERIIKLPAHLIRYRLRYNILYITTALLIIIIILLVFIHDYIKKKK